jgi:8-oxo-dGTP pyrophosphatase MutT (NUDIX family)
MHILRNVVTAIWKLIPASLHWRLLWLLNPKFNVGVSGLITNPAGEVLLLRHTVRRKYAWGLPSGWVKRGETLQQALRREIREEIGLEVQPGEVIHAASGYALRIEFVLEGTLQSIDGARYGLEVSEARFCGPGDFPEDLLPAHRELMEHLLGDGEGELRRIHVH